MSEETPKLIPEDPEVLRKAAEAKEASRILRKRNAVQRLVIEKVLGRMPEGLDWKGAQDWNNKFYISYEEIGGKMSEVLDDPEQKEVRDLMEADKYEEAALLLMEILGLKAKPKPETNLATDSESLAA